MDFFHSAVTAKLIFYLGILNLIALVFLFITCRCLPMSRVGKNLMTNRYYKKLYKYHCYLWYILGISVIIHASLAIIFYGIPT